MSRSSPGRRRILSFFILFLVIALALALGSAPLDRSVIWALRVPRVILAGATGWGLAVAGSTLQVVLGNPLCEPYILGISSASALGALIGLSVGWNLEWMGVNISSFLGALFFAGFLSGFTQWMTARRAWNASSSILLLLGVIVGFLGNSLLALWMTWVQPDQMQSPLAWFFGDLSRVHLPGALFCLFGVSLVSWGISLHAQELDLLLLGEDEARSAGVNVSRLQRRLIVLTSFLVGICVSASGVIGFVGLLVPHAVRRGVGVFHAEGLLQCAIWGAVTLVGADLVSRWVFQPYELPVGVITSLVGAPGFIVLLLRGNLLFFRKGPRV